MDQVRTIDAGAPPARFARGWHCLGLAGRFRDDGPHAVAAFGTNPLSPATRYPASRARAADVTAFRPS